MRAAAAWLTPALRPPATDTPLSPLLIPPTTDRHTAIEAAYTDRNIPDRYCTVALMAENRHLIKVNEELARQVESISDELRASAAAAAGHGYAKPPAPAY